MIQDNDKLKKIIDRVIKTYYGDKIHVYKSHYYDYDDEFFEYELHYKVIPNCKIKDQVVKKNHKFCDVSVNIVKFTIDGKNIIIEMIYLRVVGMILKTIWLSF